MELKSIKNLPYQAQELYQSTFDEVSTRHDEATSHEIAWNMLKTKFVRNDKEWIAKGLGAETFSFILETQDDVLIQKADDGNFYIEGILSDIGVDRDGNAFTEEALKGFADQINSGAIFGGITHSEWQELKMKYSHLPREEFIAKARTERKGILRTIKAIYEKGKLWIKAIVDKRYANHIKRFRKMSLEALVPTELQRNGVFHGGTILGFALADDVVNPRTTVIAS